MGRLTNTVLLLLLLPICAASAATNVAAGKTPTSGGPVSQPPYLTDGLVDTTKYTSLASNLQWVQIDLGGTYLLERIRLWHYFSDARKYHDVIVQVSNRSDFASGVTTLFNNDADNSAGQGTGTDAEYVEGSDGKEIAAVVSARYVRCWSNGSTANMWNHYVELDVFASSPNLASGKIPTSGGAISQPAFATDGILDTTKYTSLSSNLQRLQIDLGQNCAIDQIKLWHYYTDARKYHDVIVQVSAAADFKSGVRTVFNNDADNSAGLGAGTDAEYVETSAGKAITISPPAIARYVRFYSNGNTQNIWNHYVEAQVFGVSSTLQVPAAPVNLLTAPGDAKVSASWNAAAGANSYRVKRSTTGGPPYTVIASVVTSTSYVDSGLQNGTHYTFVVSAVNAAGEGPDSIPMTATPQAATPAPPTLSAQPGNGSATLTWTGLADSYTVKAGSSVNGPFSDRYTGLTTKTILDTGLENGRSYYYFVTAVNTAGESAPSNVVSVIPVSLDRFGIMQINPTTSGGREWFSSWGNGHARPVLSGDRDADDNQFIARGDGQTDVTGTGEAQMAGDHPRMYVYDAAKTGKWKNVEVTFYARRISETATDSAQGWVAGVRSEHQDASDTNPCAGRTYYGRLLYDGRVVFQKEIVHHGLYSNNQPSETNYGSWTGSMAADGLHRTMQTNDWIGFKLIVRNVSNDAHVHLELFRDMSDGAGGGTWEKLIEYTDQGNWIQQDATNNVCGLPVNAILNGAGTSVFIRNDFIGRADYKKFSIREIGPLP